MRIGFLAYGTRGDVQPALALALALERNGHEVRLLADARYADWIAAHGLEPVRSAIDTLSKGARELIAKGSDPGSSRRLLKKHLDAAGISMATESWTFARDAEVIGSNFFSCLFAASIAEKTGARHVSLRVFPSIVPTESGVGTLLAPLPDRASLVNYKAGQAASLAVSSIFDGVDRRLRSEVLGLPPLTREESELRLGRALVLHCYSAHVVPHPPDWPENLHTTGYCFVAGDHFECPGRLAGFLASGSPPVAIGFGSMTPDSDDGALTNLLVEAVELASVRAVLLSGSSGTDHSELTPNLFSIPFAPHDWLYPHCAAVVHHGGCGTTASALLAGKPSVVVPFAGDQMFWGRRLAALGVAAEPLPRAALTAPDLAAAIRSACSDAGMRRRAGELSARIGAEDGVREAVALIERHIR